MALSSGDSSGDGSEKLGFSMASSRDSCGRRREARMWSRLTLVAMRRSQARRFPPRKPRMALYAAMNVSWVASSAEVRLPSTRADTLYTCDW